MGRVLFSCVLFVVAAAPGCRAVGDALRPAAPSTAAATPPVTRGAATSYGEPLIVDWPAEQRGDLELAMRSGVAVVAYDFQTLRLLPACSLDGTYGFLGMTPKERVVRLESADDLRANLPLTGVPLSSQLGSAMQRGTTIDVALVMVGKRTSTRASVARADLHGECADATHFVHGALIGAFAMHAGERARASSVASLFGFGGGARTESSREINNSDGSLDDCRQADPTASEPPPHCGALLRLQLTPIAIAARDEIVASADVCPSGLVLSEGKCTTPTSTATFQCEAEQPTECEAQCTKGHAGSCAMLGYVLERGLAGTTPDPTRAAALYDGACGKGEPVACNNLGALLASGTLLEKDEPRAVTLFDRACREGDAHGCGNVGVMYARGAGVAHDELRGAALLKQACDGGDSASCSNLGAMFANGSAVARDEARAVLLFKQGCDGNSALGCANLGAMYADGRGVARDATRARALLKQACDGGYTWGCDRLKAVPRDAR